MSQSHPLPKGEPSPYIHQLLVQASTVDVPEERLRADIYSQLWSFFSEPVIDVRRVDAAAEMVHRFGPVSRLDEVRRKERGALSRSHGLPWLDLPRPLRIKVARSALQCAGAPLLLLHEVVGTCGAVALRQLITCDVLQMGDGGHAGGPGHMSVSQGFADPAALPTQPASVSRLRGSEPLLGRDLHLDPLVRQLKLPADESFTRLGRPHSEAVQNFLAFLPSQESKAPQATGAGVPLISFDAACREDQIMRCVTADVLVDLFAGRIDYSDVSRALESATRTLRTGTQFNVKNGSQRDMTSLQCREFLLSWPKGYDAVLTRLYLPQLVFHWLGLNDEVGPVFFGDELWRKVCLSTIAPTSRKPSTKLGNFAGKVWKKVRSRFSFALA